MTETIDTASKRRLSAKLAAGLAISAMLALGTSAVPAHARAYHHYYNGGYYRAPPVVYGSRYGYGYYGSPYYGGSPYYYAPPLVYGPSIGINLPGLSIGIR
ncbi:MAG TPA: hypothetical protein VND95_13030 [Stellaceae bacterium]|nr:hypothetical protein [Stellaceae bacterium]